MKDIIEISADGNRTIAIDKNGTVFTTGGNKCDISKMKDVIYA